MKVLFAASDCSCVSGAFLALVTLAHELKDKGVDVEILIPWNDTAGEALLKENGLPYTHIYSYPWVVSPGYLSYKRRLKNGVKHLYNHIAARRIKRLIRRGDFDIVHINTLWHYAAAEAVMQLPNRPLLIWHMREFLEEDHNRVFDNKEKALALIAKADCAVAVSSAVADKYKADLKNIRVILDGIEPSETSGAKRDLFGNATLYCAMAGVMGDRKGTFEALEALQLLQSNEPSGEASDTVTAQHIVLDLYGQCSETARYKIEQMLEEIHPACQVNIHGKVTDVQTCLGQTDIFLMCSRCEAFGRVTVEAMMAGCLVIGADSGGTPEIIQDGVTGLLYRSGDAADLARAIRWALNNPAAANSIARAGQIFALQNLTSERNTNEVFALYNELMGTNPGEAR